MHSHIESAWQDSRGFALARAAIALPEGLTQEVLMTEDVCSRQSPHDRPPKATQAYAPFAKVVKARLATSLEPWVYLFVQILLTQVGGCHDAGELQQLPRGLVHFHAQLTVPGQAEVTPLLTRLGTDAW